MIDVGTSEKVVLILYVILSVAKNLQNTRFFGRFTPSE